MITIKGPQGGFIAIIPVAGCKGCPFRDERFCGFFGRAGAPLPTAGYVNDPSWSPVWCPAIANAQNELPGTADLDFMLNDAIVPLQGESNE